MVQVGSGMFEDSDIYSPDYPAGKFQNSGFHIQLIGIQVIGGEFIHPVGVPVVASVAITIGAVSCGATGKPVGRNNLGRILRGRWAGGPAAHRLPQSLPGSICLENDVRQVKQIVSCAIQGAGLRQVVCFIFGLGITIAGKDSVGSYA